MSQKKYTVAIGLLVMLAVAAGSFFFQNSRNGGVERRQSEANNAAGEESGSSGTVQERFFLAGWLPYWAKEAGAEALHEKIGIFSEINSFAYGVDADGNLVDTLNIGASPWPGLIAEARKNNVKIIPTILWGDAAAMHKIFTHREFLHRHIDAIVQMLDQHDFSGVDIDYEGKDVADRENFTLFLKTLHEKLASDRGKTLDCTVEARTQDAPPIGFTGTRAMSYANDFSALNEYCDCVRVMAYDEALQIHRANTFEEATPVPIAPNADSRWVEEVAKYALRSIAPGKLVLGVPTYGWEFQFQKVAEGYRYKRVRSVNYADALREARAAGVTPFRTAGGELSFTYQGAEGARIVTIDDSESVKNKIQIAEALHLKGISLFKIDGLADPNIFTVLENKVNDKVKDGDQKK